MLSLTVRGVFLRISKHSYMRSALFVLLWATGHGAEVTGVTNVALHKPGAQGPRIRDNCYATHAVDGILDRYIEKCASTELTYSNILQWWMVDLEEGHWIHKLRILNRADCCGWYLQNFTIDVFLEDPRALSGFPSDKGKICARRIPMVGIGEWVELQCDPGPLFGRFVRVLKWGNRALNLCEVRVFGYKCPALAVRRFEPYPGWTARGSPDHDIGVFTNPMKCALELDGHDQIKVFIYQPTTGQCYGFNNPSWVEYYGVWETYKEV